MRQKYIKIFKKQSTNKIIKNNNIYYRLQRLVSRLLLVLIGPIPVV